LTEKVLLREEVRYSATSAATTVLVGALGFVVVFTVDLQNQAILAIASLMLVLAGLVGIWRRGRLWYEVVVSDQRITWGRPGRMIEIPLDSIRDVEYTDFGEVHLIAVRRCDGKRFQLHRVQYDQLRRIYGALAQCSLLQPSPARENVLIGPCG
jgi:hypothetical protein